MTIGAQQIEGWVCDSGTAELFLVCGIVGHAVRDDQSVETFQIVGRRRLPDHDQVEARIVESREEVLDVTARREFEPKPGEAIAGTWRTLGQIRQSIAREGFAGSEFRSVRSSETRADEFVRGSSQKRAAWGTIGVRSCPASQCPRRGRRRLDRSFQQPFVRPACARFHRSRAALSLLALPRQARVSSQVIRVLQSGVHALRAHRAVDVSGISEQETPTIPEALRAPMVDAIRREPVARLERGAAPTSLPMDGTTASKSRSSRIEAPSVRSPRRANDRSHASERTDGIHPARDRR